MAHFSGVERWSYGWHVYVLRRNGTARSAPKKKKVVFMSYAALVLCALRCAEDDYRLLYFVQLSIASASFSMPVRPLLVCRNSLHPSHLGCIAVC